MAACYNSDDEEDPSSFDYLEDWQEDMLSGYYKTNNNPSYNDKETWALDACITVREACDWVKKHRKKINRINNSNSNLPAHTDGGSSNLTSFPSTSRSQYYQTTRYPDSPYVRNPLSNPDSTFESTSSHPNFPLGPTSSDTDSQFIPPSSYLDFHDRPPSRDSDSNFPPPSRYSDSLFRVPSSYPYSQFGPTSSSSDSRCRPTSSSPESRCRPTSSSPESRCRPTSSSPESRCGPTSSSPESRCGPTSSRPDSRFGLTSSRPDSQFGPTSSRPDSQFGPTSSSPDSPFRSTRSNPVSPNSPTSSNPCRATSSYPNTPIKSASYFSASNNKAILAILNKPLLNALPQRDNLPRELSSAVEACNLSEKCPLLAGMLRSPSLMDLANRSNELQESSSGDQFPNSVLDSSPSKKVRARTISNRDCYQGNNLPSTSSHESSSADNDYSNCPPHEVPLDLSPTKRARMCSCNSGCCSHGRSLPSTSAEFIRESPEPPLVIDDVYAADDYVAYDDDDEDDEDDENDEVDDADEVDADEQEAIGDPSPLDLSTHKNDYDDSDEDTSERQ